MIDHHYQFMTRYCDGEPIPCRVCGADGKTAKVFGEDGWVCSACYPEGLRVTAPSVDSTQ